MAAVVSNCVLSRLILKEHLSWLGLLGVFFAIFGSVGVALNAPSAEAGTTDSGSHDARGLTPPERVIYDSIITWRTFVYTCIVFFLAMYTANPFSFSCAISDEYRKKQVAIRVCIQVPMRVCMYKSRCVVCKWA